MPEMRSSVQLHYTEMKSGLFYVFGQKHSNIAYTVIQSVQWLHIGMENIDLAIWKISLSRSHSPQPPLSHFLSDGSILIQIVKLHCVCPNKYDES